MNLGKLIFFGALQLLAYRAAKTALQKYEAKNVENENKNSIYNKIDIDKYIYNTVKDND